jgi:hypothetical protein
MYAIRSVDSYLLPQHQALLEGSAINADVIAARGYRSEKVKVRLAPLGFTHSQWQTPCLVVPVWGIEKKVVMP